MKTNKIFALAAFAATALFAASCSSEEPANPGDKIGPGDPAQISIQLTSPVSPTSRAEADYGFDYDAEDDDKVINDFIIFVTRTDGSFDIAPKYYAGKGREYGVPVCWWDNGAFTGSGENFGLLNRRELKWEYPEVVAAFVGKE